MLYRFSAQGETMRVLVIEDAPEVADLVRRALVETGWAVDLAQTAAEGARALQAARYDLAVIDLNLPDGDGLEVCRRARARGCAVPILILTARGALGDRVTGLDAGADDYLVKPFDVAELLARLRALARRSAEPLPVTLRVADLELDTAALTVRRDGIPLRLTARERALLEYLMRNKGRVRSRTQIIDNVWDDSFDPVGNVVDVLVGRLRRKVDRPGMPALIHTVRAFGYVLSEESPDSAT